MEATANPNRFCGTQASCLAADGVGRMINVAASFRAAEPAGRPQPSFGAPQRPLELVELHHCVGGGTDRLADPGPLPIGRLAGDHEWLVATQIEDRHHRVAVDRVGPPDLGEAVDSVTA